MSSAISNRRKQRTVEEPEVTLQAAIPITNEESSSPESMQRLTSIRIDPENIPDGMKSAARRKEERLKREQMEAEEKLKQDEKNKRMLKLIAFGSAIAVGAIVAYKASGYLSHKDIEKLVEDTIVEQ